MKIKRYLQILGLCALVTGCGRNDSNESIVAIQIQDRNGLTETVSSPDRLDSYLGTDFLDSQPYKKVLRLYRKDGKSHSKITTYHPNGKVWQYLEAEELRAHGPYLEWHPNGQQRIESWVIGGSADVAQGAQRDWLFDGVSKVWDEKGNLLAEIPYENGTLEGQSTYYFPSGAVEKKIPYHNHILDGVSEEFFPNGSLKASTTYKFGEKNGPSKGFFQSGEVAWNESYKEDLLLQGIYFSPKGEVISEVESGTGFRALFEENNLSYLIQIQQGIAQGGVKHFSEKGDLHSTYHIKNGRKTGIETIYFPPSELAEKTSNPQPKLSIDWDDGKIQGSVKTWYPNGQLQSQREFCRNKKMGPSLAWYKNGSLMLVEEYEEDKLLSGQYYKKNAQDSVSSIVNGTGVAHLYDENGIFLRKVTYSKGEAVDSGE